MALSSVTATVPQLVLCPFPRLRRVLLAALLLCSGREVVLLTGGGKRQTSGGEIPGRNAGFEHARGIGPVPLSAAACACRSALGSTPRGSLLPPPGRHQHLPGAQGRQIRALWCHVRSFLWAQVRREGADRWCCESAPVLLRPQLGGRALFTGRELERSSGKMTRAQKTSCFPSKSLSGDGEQPSCSSVLLSAELAGFLPQPPRCRGAAPRPVSRWRWDAVTQGESTRPSAPPLYLPATEAAALDLSRLCQHSQRPSWRLGTGGPPGSPSPPP